MRTVHFTAALPSRLAGFVSSTARQPRLCFGKSVMSWHVYMLPHHYSAQIQLGIHQFVFTVLHNHTQALPTTDEEVPVLKNLQSKIRSNTSEGNNRKEQGVQEESWATAHLGETCILVGQLKKIIHPIQALVSLCMVIMEEISEHGKGWLKDGGRSRVKEGLSHFLSSFLPLGSLADLSKARAHMSEHQNLFHCDITDAMACEITMCKAEGADYLGKHLLQLWHPTKLGNKHISVHLTTQWNPHETPHQQDTNLSEQTTQKLSQRCTVQFHSNFIRPPLLGNPLSSAPWLVS